MPKLWVLNLINGEEEEEDEWELKFGGGSNGFTRENEREEEEEEDLSVKIQEAINHEEKQLRHHETVYLYFNTSPYKIIFYFNNLTQIKK